MVYSTPRRLMVAAAVLGAIGVGFIVAVASGVVLFTEGMGVLSE